LHAVNVERCIAEVAGQIDAADPLRARRHADPARPDDRPGRMRAMAADVHRRPAAVPRVEPVILILPISATIAVAQRRMVALHAAVRFAYYDTLARDTKLIPHPIGADHAYVPLRA